MNYSQIYYYKRFQHPICVAMISLSMHILKVCICTEVKVLWNVKLRIEKYLNSLIIIVVLSLGKCIFNFNLCVIYCLLSNFYLYKKNEFYIICE